MLSEASLNLVAVRKSFYGSALFLCRRQSVSKQPVFLPVDSKDYQWVETLKVSPTFVSLSVVVPEHSQLAHRARLIGCFLCVFSVLS